MAEDLPGYEFHEDILQILAGVPWSKINEISFFDQLEESEVESNDDDSEVELNDDDGEVELNDDDSEVELNDDDSNPPDTLENSELDLSPDFIREEDFGFTCNEGIANLGQSSRNYATVKLLEKEFTDKDALLTIYPNAGLENNSIGTSHYILVVKRLLMEWKVSGRDEKDNDWLSYGDLKSPHAYARILRRLVAELRFVQSGEGYDAKHWSDPTSFYTCLEDLLNDMIEGCKHLEVRDGEVNVYKETKLYEDCLFSMAEVLQRRQG